MDNSGPLDSRGNGTPESQLNLRLRHPDFQRFLDINERESELVRKQYSYIPDEPYGDHALQTMDVFPARRPHAPIFVFIHGGYWRGLDKSSYSFTAKTFLERNFAACVINYRLLPSTSLAGMLEDIRDAIIQIRRDAQRFNGQPDSLSLVGHSAGAHLALMACLLYEDVRNAARALCGISGLYDLEPIRNSYLNETLMLSVEDVKKYSPVHRDAAILSCPFMLSVGLDETDLFIEQSKKYFIKNKNRAALEYFEHPDLNHYQIVQALLDEDDPLSRFILKFGSRAA